MVRFLKYCVLFFALFISCSGAFAGQNDFATFNFMGKDFCLYELGPNAQYDMTNRFFSDGFEKKDCVDGITLFYSKTGYPLKPIFYSLKKEYDTSAGYRLGTSKITKNKFAISFIGEEYGKIAYSIIKMENNNIAGLNSYQIYINIPDAKTDIKKLDDKYFQNFYKAKFPPVVDETGKVLPHKYTMKFNDTTFTLKYAITEKGEGANYYLAGKENFTNYKKIIRINYRTDRINPNKMVDEIKDSVKQCEGFRIIRDEKFENGRILSYTQNLYDLKNKKVYTALLMYKILPYKSGIKSMEYSVNLLGENISEQIVKETEIPSVQALQAFEIPELIPENFGRLPDFSENSYQHLIKGIPE